jgi:hypothetical protein
MDERETKVAVLLECMQHKGKMWPNGYGFSARRWEYYLDDAGKWHARTLPLGCQYGVGDTPDAARGAAKDVRDSERERQRQ